MRAMLLHSYKRVINLTRLAFPSVCSRPKESWKCMSLVNVLFCLVLYSNSHVSRTLRATYKTACDPRKGSDFIDYVNFMSFYCR